MDISNEEINKYVPLDQFIRSKGIDKRILKYIKSKEKLSKIFDVNEKYDDLYLIRINKELVNNWLKNKFIAVSFGFEFFIPFKFG